MLKDRRVLLEQEIARVFDEAAAKYLDIVVNDGDVHSAEYQSLKEKVMKLQFDLDIKRSSLAPMGKLTVTLIELEIHDSCHEQMPLLFQPVAYVTLDRALNSEAGKSD